MEDIRHPKQLLGYRPMGRRRRRIEWSLQRPMNGHNHEAETDHLLA